MLCKSSIYRVHPPRGIRVCKGPAIQISRWQTTKHYPDHADHVEISRSLKWSVWSVPCVEEKRLPGMYQIWGLVVASFSRGRCRCPAPRMPTTSGRVFGKGREIGRRARHRCNIAFQSMVFNTSFQYSCELPYECVTFRLDLYPKNPRKIPRHWSPEPSPVTDV